MGSYVQLETYTQCLSLVGKLPLSSRQNVTNHVIYPCIDEVDEVSKIIKEQLTNSDSSRLVVCRELNPMLSLHAMYHSGLCETYRVDTTRLRISSHRLKIKTGRWAWILCEERLCHVEMEISNQNPTFLFIVNIPESWEKDALISILTTFHV